MTPSANSITVGLIGNPNCGKTTIFNALTGARQKVANWSGVTIEKREGSFRAGEYSVRVVDLPGIYSLSAYSLEEIVARDYIIHEQPDVIVNIVDAGNLERNLYLTTQLINIGVRVILVLNMSDEAEAKGIVIDTDTLGTLLGMPVVRTVGTRNDGIGRLIAAIIAVAEKTAPVVRHLHIDYGADVEEEIQAVQRAIRTVGDIGERYSTRWLAIRLLENDCDVLAKLEGFPNYAAIVGQAERSRRILEKNYGDDPAMVLTERRQGFVTGLLKEAVRRVSVEKTDVSERIDRVLMNRYLGYPILLAFLWLLFQATYVLGEYPKQGIQWLVDALSHWLALSLPDGAVKSLVVKGVVGGVGGVIVFLPNILILFLGVSFLEDSGYMARAAFIMDKIMHRLGIHGKSFIPLIMGFGCNVPAIMATRTLESRRDRIITVLINPFMSCSARLPVYVLFAGVFFAQHAGTVILALYLIGIAIAFVTSRLFNMLLAKTESAPFVMELPPYRLPTARSTLLHVWNRASQYLKKMSGPILAFSVIIWVISEYPVSETAVRAHAERVQAAQSAHRASYGEVARREGTTSVNASALKAQHDQAIAEIARDYEREKLRHSSIGIIGRAIHPAMEPLGFNWQMGVSLVTGVFAKEVVVSSLGVLYAVNAPGARATCTKSLEGELTSPEHGITPLRAFTYMLFVLLYIPCIATIVVIGREIGWRWAAVSVAYNLALTWAVCFLVFNAGRLLGLP